MRIKSALLIFSFVVFCVQLGNVNGNIERVFGAEKEATINTDCKGGYYKGEYEPPTPYVNNYGLYYVGNDDDLCNIVNIKKTGDKELTIEVPYVFPMIIDTLPGHQERGFYREYWTKDGAEFNCGIDKTGDNYELRR